MSAANSSDDTTTTTGNNLFPLINHLDQVKQAIGSDTDDFKFMTQDNYLFYCYGRVKTTTFPSIESGDDEQIQDMKKIRREIRGLAFDKDSGKLVSRCLHKFFNLDENAETNTEYLENKYNPNGDCNLLDIFLVLEKLDGSMIMPIIVDGKIVFRTKRGYFNQVTNQADKFVAESQVKYLEFCTKLMKEGYTPIFEFYSKENMVVIEYDSTFLTLIAIRYTEKGDYVPYNEMCEMCNEFSIPFVKCIFSNTDQDEQSKKTVIKSFKQLKSKVNTIKGIEGVVIRHKVSGEMFKFKTNWYSEQHKKKQLVTDGNPSPAHIWKFVMDDCIDDIIPVLNTEKEKQELRRFNDEVLNAIDDCAKRSLEIIEFAMNLGSAKETASYIAQESGHNTIFKKIVYKIKTEIDKKTNQQDYMSPQDVVKYFLLQFIFKDLNLVKECLNTPDLVYTNYKITN
ncbi:predicted protein [Naegleria gruberi]|uniref:Predicted protein n=1 Tax=Naegleria gruberi TaxID=5762 RepID=D2VXP5_NAEGR|nr:uncharacterized protein NAEGRDRAFT_73822 [Naegleria gruberi]EFC38327.1 predicted protein [Naegleria gruberi]|eukprot:XP_002671071.1 predicted protein [Naegleria gruberi strain NEG-M]